MQEVAALAAREIAGVRTPGAGVPCAFGALKERRAHRDGRSTRARC
ncbi:hypothetical protein [Amycolatopsis sp. FDAARGOS 1241]